MTSTKVNAWILGVMGVLAVALGIYLITLTEATCEGEVMAAGDRCVTVSKEREVSQDRDQMLKSLHLQGHIAAGAGGLILLGAGAVVLRGRRRRRFEQDVDVAAGDWNRVA